MPFSSFVPKHVRLLMASTPTTLIRLKSSSRKLLYNNNNNNNNNSPSIRLLKYVRYPSMFSLFAMDYSSSGAALGHNNNNNATVLPKPSEMYIPLDRVEFSYARSSGPGGQNVNKVNTKAEIRFHVMSADWIPHEVRQRLMQYQNNKVSKEGELIVTSQEHRTQAKNKEDCLEKLRFMLAEVGYLIIQTFYHPPPPLISHQHPLIILYPISISLTAA